MNIADIIKGMSKSQLEDAVKKAKEFAETEKGKALVEKLKAEGMPGGKISKEEILEKLNDNPDLAKKISDIINGKD